MDESGHKQGLAMPASGRAGGAVLLRAPQRRGFSLIELMLAVGLLALLAGILLVTVSRARASAKGVGCLNNLRQIGLSFQTYSSENGGRIPDPLAEETTWESKLRRQLGSTEVLLCPADTHVFDSIGSSYDWRDSGDVTASVAGRLIQQCRSDAVLAFDALPGWHRPAQMNVVRVDGSAHALPEQECLADLRRPVTRSGAAGAAKGVRGPRPR
jgi:prepilin-type N-terminal cleavage/methylation domain-containing protein